MTYRSSMQVIADRTGQAEAAEIVNDLRAAGYIIVRHDAIRLAQAHARGELREDNDNEWWRLPTTATAATANTGRAA